MVSSHTQRNALVTLNWKLCVRVYVCIYIPKAMDLCVCEGFVEQGTCAADAQRLRDIRALLWGSALTAELMKSFCHLPQRCCSPSNQAELLMAHPWLLLLHPQLPLGPRESSSHQQQAPGTCISCLLNLRYEKGQGRARGGHGLAAAGHALSSKPSRFSHGGTATIHLWLCHPAPSLLMLQMNIL